MELIIKALAKPDALFWYVSPSYRQSKMIAWKMLKQFAPKFLIAKVNESELSITFKNNTVIELKGADNEDALRGAGLDGMVIDEFASIYDNWSVWNEVLRPALTDKKGWVLFIGTPKGKDSFFELYMKGQREEDGFMSWQFTTVDNPYIDPEEIEQARKSMPERYFKQEFEASFEDFVGLVWPEYSERQHVIAPFTIPDWWKIEACIDPAISGTTGMLWMATDEEGISYICDEFRKRDQRVSDIKAHVDLKSHKVDSWFIDPASKAKNQRVEGQLYSLFDEYSDIGIKAQPAENDVEAGIHRVAEYLKNGKLKIFSTCRHLIWEIERYHWAERKETIKGETKATVFKKDDHLCDCLRYLIMSRPQASQATERKPARLSTAWFEKMEEDRNEDWRGKYN